MRKVFLLAVVLCGLSSSVFLVQVAECENAELVIVKYGSVMVKSSVLDARVFIDDAASGSVNSLIDSVAVGDHVVSCRSEGKTVSGTFKVKKNETLRLEARFDEDKLIDSTEAERAAAEAAKKKKVAEAAKLEELKKAALDAKKVEPKRVESKKVEPKNPKESFRELHLNIIKVQIEADTPDIHVSGKVDPQVISKYSVKKEQSGKYYQTKQGILLCEAGPCQKEWSSTFQYTDETGKSDSFLVRWREIVFNGITPTGTSKRELEWCLNGACRKLEDAGAPDSDTALELVMDRYVLGWTRSLIIIRRADVMKEIVNAGGDVTSY